MKKFAFIWLLMLLGIHVSAQTTPLPNDTLKFKANKKYIHSFLDAVNRAGLDIFNGEQPLTIFAPDDTTFKKLLTVLPDSLYKPENKQALVNFLNAHMVNRRLSAKEIGKLIASGNGQATFTTLAGTKLVARINANRNIVLDDENGSESVIKRFDIPRGNVMLFVIRSLPPHAAAK